MKRPSAIEIKLPLSNRTAAGVLLANELAKVEHATATIVLALPRGGLPVAAEIARVLNAPLDLMLVRKLGTPRRMELAMGAIAGRGTRVLNSDVIWEYGVSESEISEIEAWEREEMERRREAYLGDRPQPQLRGRSVVLVDDGLATGATMRAAIDAAREEGAAEIIVAVPVAPLRTLRELRHKVDEIYCLATPEPFVAIGPWYQDFGQVSDKEVCQILKEAWAREESTDFESARDESISAAASPA